MLTNEPDPGVAGVGVNPECAILRVGNGRLGNIGNIIACGLSFFVVLGLIGRVTRRKAAVGMLFELVVAGTISISSGALDPLPQQVLWNSATSS